MLELVIVTQLLHLVGMQPLSQLLPVSRQLNDCDTVFSSPLPDTAPWRNNLPIDRTKSLSPRLQVPSIQQTILPAGQTSFQPCQATSLPCNHSQVC